MTGFMRGSNSTEAAPATVLDVPLDPRRAREVQGAGRKAEEWRARRDELIRQAHADGASYREIAALVGLSHVGVMKIVGKEANDERDQRINAIKRERERERERLGRESATRAGTASSDQRTPRE